MEWQTGPTDIEEDVDVINEEINEVLEDIENDEATNVDKDDDKNDPASAAEAPTFQMMEVVGEENNVPTTTTEAMQAMYVLSKYCREQGFDKQLSDLAQIEKDTMRRRKEKVTVQRSLTSYFCSARKYAS